MRTASFSPRFEKDVKRLQKRGKDMAKLKKLMELLLEGGVLPPKYVDHPLKRNWEGFRDAHLEPDCVLIYLPSKSNVTFERTGTHEELFDKP